MSACSPLNVILYMFLTLKFCGSYGASSFVMYPTFVKCCSDASIRVGFIAFKQNLR